MAPITTRSYCGALRSMNCWMSTRETRVSNRPENVSTSCESIASASRRWLSRSMQRQTLTSPARPASRSAKSIVAGSAYFDSGSANRVYDPDASGGNTRKETAANVFER